MLMKVPKKVFRFMLKTNRENLKPYYLIKQLWSNWLINRIEFIWHTARIYLVVVRWYTNATFCYCRFIDEWTFSKNNAPNNLRKHHHSCSDFTSLKTQARAHTYTHRRASRMPKWPSKYCQFPWSRHLILPPPPKSEIICSLSQQFGTQPMAAINSLTAAPHKYRH